MTYHAITLYEMTCNQPPPKIFINPTDPANGDGTYNDSGWGIYSITGYVANFEAMGGPCRCAKLQGPQNPPHPGHHRWHLQHDHVHHYEWMPVINYWRNGPSSTGYITGPATKFQVSPTYAGVNATCDFRLATAHGAGGLPVCLADGSVRTVNPGISGQTWWFAMTPNGGEVLSNDW